MAQTSSIRRQKERGLTRRGCVAETLWQLFNILRDREKWREEEKGPFTLFCRPRPLRPAHFCNAHARKVSAFQQHAIGSINKANWLHPPLQKLCGRIASRRGRGLVYRSSLLFHRKKGKIDSYYFHDIIMPQNNIK